MERKVFSPLGGKVQNGAFYFSFTLGEPIVGTDDNQLPIFTKGFEQPIDPSILDLIRREQEENELEKPFSFYPHPFKDHIKIQYVSPQEGSKSLQIFNASGALLGTKDFTDEELSTGSSWDLSGLASGTYWLIFSDLGKRAVFSLRKE
ncbi:MAG: T9SS type A sorting domain-containing protein [Bacteroidota bacterium]